MATASKDPRERKRRTVSSRRFSYESFSQRLAKLPERKIDPTHRVRRHVDDEGASKSFFQSSLSSWMDLNLSTSFTEFSREVRPLSESLPLILHHKEGIYKSLHQHIDRRDVLALEPLLDLLAQLARDLGAEFEPFLGSSVALLSSLVTKFVDIETLEWTFNCLAYLLKYLSRLLVPDLRPLYEVLAPLLGREPQKPFVTRFAAESLGFLVRKAKGESLGLVVRHSFEDLRKHALHTESGGYPMGVTTMLYEACISLDKTIHSKGPSILEAAMSAVAVDLSCDPVCVEAIVGVVVGIIHHCTAETFTQMQKTIAKFACAQISDHREEAPIVGFAARLLFTVAATRKGSRVTSWEDLSTTASDLFDTGLSWNSSTEAETEALWATLKTLAMIMQYAELDLVTSKCSRIAERVTKWKDGQLFLPYCEFVSECGRERFGQFIMPSLRGFIRSRWHAYESPLCLLIPKLVRSGILQAEDFYADTSTETSPITRGMLHAVKELLSALGDPVAPADTHNALLRVYSFLDVLDCVQQNRTQSISYEPFGLLLNSLSKITGNLALGPIAGKTLRLLSNQASGPVALIRGSLTILLTQFRHNSIFLEGFLDYARCGKLDEYPEDERHSVLGSLIANLSSPSHTIRRTSLSILETLSRSWDGPLAKSLEVLQAMISIEDTPFTIANQRNLSMFVRKLGVQYRNIRRDSLEAKMVPAYCFGLMTVQFTPLWEDAAKALGIVAESNEEIVAHTALMWLSGADLTDVGSSIPADEPPSHKTLSPFQCSNLETLAGLSVRCRFNGSLAKDLLDTQMKKAAHSVELPLSVGRSSALQVLCEIHNVAEKRSRQIVPLFLEWSSLTSQDIDEDDEAEHSASSHKWSRKDQASMLTLFSKFENPKVLYKADEVYASLLRLLTSGDIKIQSLALKCILKWRDPAVRAYQDRLNNLLDSTMFRDELTHFVRVEDESQISTEYRDALIPILLRLLYGRSLSRKNASSGKKGMAPTRVAILESLANLRPHEQAVFIDIALANVKDARFVHKADPDKFEFNLESIGHIRFSLRKQLGLVRMIEDMLKQLGSTLLPHLPPMVDAVLYCLVSSVLALNDKAGSAEDHVVKSLKAIRVGGFKCLCLMIGLYPTHNWGAYLPAVFDTLVNPRMEKLPAETSQGVSSLLQLFAALGDTKYTILYLARFNPKVIATLADCLLVDGVKDNVVMHILDLLRRIVEIASSIDENDEAVSRGVKDYLLAPNVDALLRALSSVLHKGAEKEILEKCIETIALLAPFSVRDTEAIHLVSIVVFLLGQPARRVSPKVKSGIVRILIDTIPKCDLESSSELYGSVFRAVSSLFGFFRDRESREMVVNALNIFAVREEPLREIAFLSQRLNSFSTKRLNEPDFEQRLKAFATINEDRYAQFNARQWLPILYNMFYFIRDNEELAIRTNATYCLKRFVEVCGKRAASNDDEYMDCLGAIVLPVLRRGAREQSEIIRQEYVAVMAHVVRECERLAGVSDMHSLLMSNDEEANFFNNILHIQQHRRLRALRRLAGMAKTHGFQSHNVAHFFIPLIEHFVFDAAEDAHELSQEAVLTIGTLCEQLTWSQYRVLFKKYMRCIQSKPSLAKTMVRLIGAVVAALTRTYELGPGATAEGPRVGGTTKASCTLYDSLPSQQVLADEVSKSILPGLGEYLHQKDESTVSLRVPIAVSIMKLLKIMPEDMIKARLPATLMDVCHILRSRAQDDRDTTRKALAEIALSLGPPYFSFILRELQGSLQRGYQKHVLSYTVHSILVVVAPEFQPGALDYCVSLIVEIIMDDIFGVIGSEKDAEGYVNKMKEVKSNKSYDSMDVLASITTPAYLGRLIYPVRLLLTENLTLKIVTKIDELLRRITVGLLRNEAMRDRSLLVFCYEVVQEVYKADGAMLEAPEEDEKRRRYLVNLKAPSRAPSRVATCPHIFRLTKFALEILRTTLVKHDELATPENLAGFIPIIGDAILSDQEEVNVSAIRLLAAIIRVPFQDIDDGADVFVNRTVGLVKASPSTNSELAQASLKLIAAILRERKSVKIKDTIIGYLLSRIRPDLEEPHLQGVTFNFVKAVLSRRIAIPEIYETMDEVASIMVTNQSHSVRDLCRGVYFQFIMDYPQGRDRWKKQLAFLVKNLDYKHESGRKSVLDAIHLVVTKVGDKIIQDIVGTFFAPLIMVLVNDESADCREMTGVLLKEVIRRADEERKEAFLQVLKLWLGYDQNPLLVRASLQVYGLYFDGMGVTARNEVLPLFKRLLDILAFAADAEPGDSVRWEIIYFALQLWAKFTQLFPDATLSSPSLKVWQAVRDCLRYPHQWVRLASSRLLGILFSNFPEESLSELPLDNGQGLTLEGRDLMDMAYMTSGQLNSLEITEESATQAIKNLLFLARCFYSNSMSMTPAALGHDEPLDDPDENKEAKTTLLWVVERISGIIRSEHNIKNGLVGKKYGLKFLAALVSIMDKADLIPLARRIIEPLYNLVELPEGHPIKELKATAQEILSMLQAKIGTTDYTTAHSEVKQGVSRKRQQRRHKRAIEAVAEPELAAKRKARKHERKKEVRKEKNKRHKEWRRGRRL